MLCAPHAVAVYLTSSSLAAAMLHSRGCLLQLLQRSAHAQTSLSVHGLSPCWSPTPSRSEACLVQQHQPGSSQPRTKLTSHPTCLSETCAACGRSRFQKAVLAASAGLLSSRGHARDAQRRSLAAHAQPAQADSDSEEEVKQPHSQQLPAVQRSIGFIGAGQVGCCCATQLSSTWLVSSTWARGQEDAKAQGECS